MKELFMEVARLHTEAFHKSLKNDLYMGLQLAYDRVLYMMYSESIELQSDPECFKIAENIVHHYPALSSKD